MRAELLDVLDKNFYEQNYISSYKQYDLYILFYERSLKILKDNGLLGFITPNKFYIADYGLKIREFLLKNSHLYKIVDVSMMNVFSDASVYPTILFLKNNTDNNAQCEVYSNLVNPDELFIKSPTIIEQDILLDSPNFVINTNVENQQILKSIERNTIELGKVFSITRGFRPPKEHLIATQESEGFYPYLEGSALSKAYNVNWNGNFVNYDTSQIDEAKPLEILLQPKVMIRDIGLNFNAFFDSGKFLLLKTIYFVYGKGINELKYLTAILNSKMMNFYFHEMYSGMHISGGYLRFRKQFLEKLPIKEISLFDQQPFIEKTDTMLLLNQQLQECINKFLRTLNRKFDLSDFSKNLQSWHLLSYKDFVKELTKKKIKLSLGYEAEWEDYFLAEQAKAQSLQNQIAQTDDEINQMVYALYGLTDDEIKIIE